MDHGAFKAGSGHQASYVDQEYDMSDSELSEGADDETDDDDDDDDDWSGQDDLEAIVLNAFGGDLTLAARLIPVIHKSLHSELCETVIQKVNPWRDSLKKCSPGADGQSPEINPLPTIVWMA